MGLGLGEISLASVVGGGWRHSIHKNVFFSFLFGNFWCVCDICRKVLIRARFIMGGSIFLSYGGGCTKLNVSWVIE